MYITPAELEGFDRYKYKSVDTSPLSKYIMHPFWNQFVKLFPLWFAPNLMTFLGFLLLVIQTAVLMYFDPHYNAAVNNVSFPVWVWIFSVFAQFFSHTLDGIDGKQARRTGTSSPLGELFDHGLDSWSASYFMFNVYTVFGRNLIPVTQMLTVLLVVLAAFFISHWEKYMTGVMYLPWSYDFAQVFLTFLYTFVAIYGSQVWRKQIFGFPIVFYFKIMMYIGSIFVSIPVSLYNVYEAQRSGSGKKRSLYEGLLPLLSPALCIFTFMFWSAMSPSDILSSQPRLVMFVAAVVFSNITCRLIVTQMSDSQCQPVNSLVIFNGLCMVVALVLNRPELEFSILWFCTIISTLAHLHYGVVVVQSLAEHFNIKVFTIKQNTS